MFVCVCVCVFVCVRAAVVFVVQYLFDEAQIMADNVGPPVHGEQWQYIYRLGLHTKHTLANVS
jgi:O-palmitoleoyl-L-serine hydrolase